MTVPSPLQSETVILTCGNRSEPARHSCRTAALRIIVHGPEPPGGRWKDWAKGGTYQRQLPFSFIFGKPVYLASERTLIGMTGCFESGARGLALTCQMQVDGKDAAMQRTSVGV